MNRIQFRTHKQQFISAFRTVLSKYGKNAELTEAAFCAYSDLNPLIRFLFWRRVCVVINFLELAGPYEAVLDFGCGGGVIMPLVAAFSKRVVGLDSNLMPCRALRNYISFPNNVEVYETQKCSLSCFPDRYFDVILALDVLEHIDNLQDVFSELCRVSKRDSTIIVCGPTENLFYRIGRKIAGKEYTGNYHVTNIYKIQKVMKSFMETKTLATLYYPFPLFKIILGKPKQ